MSVEKDLALLTTQAREARQAGRPVFIARLKASIWNQPAFGQTVEWEDCIAAVEQFGWVLTNWSVSTDASSNVSAWPVFRMPSPTTPQDRL